MLLRGSVTRPHWYVEASSGDAVERVPGPNCQARPSHAMRRPLLLSSASLSLSGSISTNWLYCPSTEFSLHQQSVSTLRQTAGGRSFQMQRVCNTRCCRRDADKQAICGESVGVNPDLDWGRTELMIHAPRHRFRRACDQRDILQTAFADDLGGVDVDVGPRRMICLSLFRSEGHNGIYSRCALSR